VKTAIDGKSVSSPDELTKVIRALKPGQTVPMQSSAPDAKSS
jgi:PDZ domain-containing secreted protein